MNQDGQLEMFLENIHQPEIATLKIARGTLRLKKCPLTYDTAIDSVRWNSESFRYICSA
jgi:hypothetical protein